MLGHTYEWRLGAIEAVASIIDFGYIVPSQYVTYRSCSSFIYLGDLGEEAFPSLAAFGKRPVGAFRLVAFSGHELLLLTDRGVIELAQGIYGSPCPHILDHGFYGTVMLLTIAVVLTTFSIVEFPLIAGRAIREVAGTVVLIWLVSEVCTILRGWVP
jgi:hypothetical protein